MATSTATKALAQGIKIILVGDSAVGKSKMTERFLNNTYNAVTTSTQGVVIHQKSVTLPNSPKPVLIDFWDTAGQATWQEMHPSFFDGAYAAILVFDIERRDTYTHLTNWYEEIQKVRKGVPFVLVANKLDVDPSVKARVFKFATVKKMPLFYVSAKSGEGVQEAFREAINLAVQCKANPPEEWLDDVLDLL
ncbi:small GTP-binding protein domain [Pelomyxa schiedti]|nr:small GTP-binding protein domain [Pelomyxa schiedti]